MDTKGELIARLEAIEDKEIKGFTKELLKAAPEVYWTARASKNHHLSDERLVGGNLLHTLRVVRLLDLIAESCRIMGLEKDTLIAAGILHDLCRYGLEGNSGYTVPEHPLLVRALAIRLNLDFRNTLKGDTLLSIIERHMGIWGNPPFKPEVNLDSLLHLADCISARAEEVWE